MVPKFDYFSDVTCGCIPITYRFSIFIFSNLLLLFNCHLSCDIEACEGPFFLTHCRVPI